MESNQSASATENLVLEGCDVCGEKHETTLCPLVNLVDHIEDQAIPSRALLSLPLNLYLQQHHELTSVYTKQEIKKGTKFGPFEAPIASTPSEGCKFPLKIFQKDGTFVHLETSNEKDCNWMCLIQAAKDESSQNLVAFQLNDGIYFTALHHIEKDQELLVGYGAGYAKKMLGVVPQTSSSGADVSDDNGAAQENFKNNVDTSVAQKLTDSALGAKKDILEPDKTMWTCNQCGAVFNHCVEFGLHLQEHTLPLIQMENENKKSVAVKKSEKKAPQAPQGPQSPIVSEERPIISEEPPDASKFTNEVHVIISTVDPEKYNLRRQRKKSRAQIEHEESLTRKSKKLKLRAQNLIPKDYINQNGNKASNDEEATGDEDVEQTGGEPSRISSSADEQKVVPSVDVNHNADDGQTDDLNSQNNDVYPCEICNKLFYKVKYLYRHLKKHTGAFVCSVCKKAFARKETLRLHSCIGMISVDKSTGLKYPCTLCNKMFGSERMLTRHFAKHTGEIKCISCVKFFYSQESFDAHECSAPLGKLHECNICLKKFSQKIYLKKHLPLHTSQYKCPICEKTLRSSESLQNHTRVCGRVHEIETKGEVTCDLCFEIFVDSKSFRKHVYTHSHPHICQKCGARFRSSVSLAIHVCVEGSCRECGRVFSGLYKLEKHLLSSCGSQHACDDCLRPFQDEESLNQHVCSGVVETDMMRKHKRLKCFRKSTDNSPPSLICETCGLMFSTISSLNVHRVLHGEKKFECEICGKKFHRKDLLQDHTAVHGEPTVKCPVCDKMLKTRKSLEVHSTLHRGIKRFKCELCGKEFFQKGNLNKHLDTHNPGRKHECEGCHKSFSTKEYLKIHQLEHSQGKIHNCNICGRSFLKSHQLNYHHRMFHSNTSYVCRYCELTVKLRHSLRRHLQKKHAELKKEWDDPEAIASMAVTSSDRTFPLTDKMCTFYDDPKVTVTTNDENEDARLKNGAEVILAVAGIGSKALEKAIAEGKAHVQQGSLPNTIEISLPVGLEGDELTQSLVQNSNIEMVDIQDQTDCPVQDMKEQNALKVFSFSQADADVGNNIETQTIVESVHNGMEDDSGSNLVISTINQTDQIQSSASDGIIVNFEDETTRQIIINQSGATSESQELALTEEGPILLYVVTDEMGETKSKLQ